MNIEKVLIRILLKYLHITHLQFIIFVFDE